MKKMIIFASIFFILAGCAMVKEIQYEAYAVGIGIDYKDEEYQVVIPFLDFSNVAKTDQGKTQTYIPTWLGVGVGKTVEEAIIEITKGIQVPINYDQISVFVFGRNLLESEIEHAVEALDTNFNIRLIGMTYGTEESLEKIFTTKVPFNFSFSISRIVQPEYMQQQSSSIPTISLQEFINQSNEKTKTVILPNISIAEGIIKEDQKNNPVTIIDGAYLMKDKKVKGLLSNQDLEGYIRVNEKSVRTQLSLIESKTKEDEYVQIEIRKPKMKRIVSKKENEIVFELEIKVEAIKQESNYKLSSKDIKKRIEEEIKTEVYTSYVKSHEVGGDIYQLEDYLYRFMYEDWKELHNHGEMPKLTSENIHVKVKPLKSINKISSKLL